MSNVISISAECLDLYSIALCHNRIQLISSITLKNISDFNLKNLEFEITSTPEFFSDYSVRIGEISSGRYMRISNVDLSIDTTRLSYLSTAVSSSVRISVKSQGEILAESVEQILLLPYDNVPSLSSYPELTAAFVTPRQPEVALLGDNVYKFLNDSSVPVNMDMWDRDDRETSYSVIKAIYNAVRDLRITYNISPILIDNKNLKIKLCENVLSYKNANTLEVAILFASVCEYLGYNPMIAFCSGKVYVGAFFKQMSQLSPISDDGRIVTRLNDGISFDCCIVDPSSMFNGANISFEDSAKMANKGLLESEYPLIVDIMECRKAGINPIHNRIQKDGNIIFEEVPLRTFEQKFKIPSNTRSLSSQVKTSIFKNDSSSPLVFVPDKRSAFLVGSGKSILTKFIFNARVYLKSFSVQGVVSQDPKQMMSALLKLNLNSDITDISDTISTLYEKGEFEKRFIKLIDTEKSKSNLYLALGLVSGEIEKIAISAPLVLIPASLSYDSQSFALSISRNAALINNAVFDYISEIIDFKLPDEIYDYDIIEDYERIIQILKEALAIGGIDILDAAFLVKAPYEAYLASAASTPEFFESSEIMSALLSKKKFTSSEFISVNSDNLQPGFFDMPILLDSTQANAFNAALANEISIVSGPNGSGKTRVASSLAFDTIAKGGSVIYASSSDSNIYKFTSYAKETGLSDFSFTVSKNNLQKNSFNFKESEVDESELSALKEHIEASHSHVANYYTALHKVRDIGFSLYEAVSQYERYKTFPYSVNFTNSDVSALSKDDVVRWFDVVSNLAKAGADAHEPYNNPLMYVKCKEFSYDLKSNALLALAEYRGISSDFIKSQNKIAEFLGIEVSIIKESQTESLVSLVNLILENISYIYPNAYERKGIEGEFVTVETFLEAAAKFFDIKEFLDNHFSQDVLTLDADSLMNDWRAASLRFAIAKAGAQNSVKNKLKVFCHDPHTVTTDNTYELLAKISTYKQLMGKITEISPVIKQIFGVDIQYETSKANKEIFADLKKSIDITRRYNSLVLELYDSEKHPEEIYHHNDSLFSNRERFLKDLEELYESFNALSKSLSQSEEGLESLLSLDIQKAKHDNSKIWYYFVEKFLDRMIDNIDLLKHWCYWNREQEKAESVGLSGVVSLYTTEQITYNDIKNAFLKGFFKTVSEFILSCEPNINNFSKDNFELVETSLISEADRYRKINNSVVYNRCLSSIKANLTEFDDKIMQLKRDFEYNDKFHNVSLSSKALLRKVKPCIITKGLSHFSQLNDGYKYDLLLIDAADEFSWEEMCLLMPLAKKVVFFTEGCNNCKFLSYIKDIGVPVYQLSWIYSYNFSTRLVNKLFYSECTTFVLPDADKKGIRVIRQKATYDRKNTRTNFIEASAVVDEIMKKLESSCLSSFAVIAMTEEQASLIELLFTKRIQSLGDNMKKAFLSRTEPFYIASLDKATFNPCDTVIFSTTFSVEERPKYNDTISRTIPELTTGNARQKLINALLCAQNEFVLVTSLDEDVLKKFKTLVPDYSVFKEILSYLCGSSNFPDAEMNKAPRIENSIIRQVINHIESLGYRADVDIGTNSCRIDLAVKNKDGDGYLFGIVFDETAYMFGGDTISRALIYKNLEKNLGWKILRIYTVEWFENSPKQLDIISELLREGEEPVSDSLISFDNL